MEMKPTQRAMLGEGNAQKLQEQQSAETKAAVLGEKQTAGQPGQSIGVMSRVEDFVLRSDFSDKLDDLNKEVLRKTADGLDSIGKIKSVLGKENDTNGIGNRARSFAADVLRNVADEHTLRESIDLATQKRLGDARQKPEAPNGSLGESSPQSPQSKQKVDTPKNKI